MQKMYCDFVEGLLKTRELEEQQHVNEWITMTGKANDLTKTHSQ